MIKQMGSVGTAVKTIKKNQMENLETTSTKLIMKNSLDDLICKLEKADESM